MLKGDSESSGNFYGVKLLFQLVHNKLIVAISSVYRNDNGVQRVTDCIEQKENIVHLKCKELLTGKPHTTNEENILENLMVYIIPCFIFLSFYPFKNNPVFITLLKSERPVEDMFLVT